MATAQAVPETGFWSTPEFPYSIEYSFAALEGIRAAAVDGLLRLRHGGIEVGGVLFGRREGESLRILTYRPLACEHAYGPAFKLSERDREELRRLIDSGNREPDLSGLEAVGWYRSHTRSAIELSEKDKSIYDDFFPHAWQISLLLRPLETGSAQAWFLVRGGGSEFTLAPVALPGRAKPVPGSDAGPGTVFGAATSARQPLPARSEPEAAAPVPTVEKALAPPLEVRPAASGEERAAAAASPPAARTGPRRTGWLWAAAILLLAAVFVPPAVELTRRRAAAPELAQLRVFDDRGFLHIEWDRNAPAVRNASRGRLIIQDGGERTEVELDPATLLNGAVTYQRRSPSVTVRLVVPGQGGEVETASRFLGRSAESPAEAETTPRAEEGGREAADERAAAQAPLPGRPVSPTPDRTRSSPVIPPIISSAPQQPSTAAEPSVAVSKDQPPAAVKVRPPAAAAYKGPRSGRLIWTGSLKRGQRLEIEGDRVSAGSLTGRLPPVPVRVTVYPGEFRENGILIHGPARPAEAASSANGWTRTEYRRNPRRARQVRVVEAPSAANHWKKLTVLSSRDLAVIAIFWEVN
ncbi:MAG: hypothetical protein IT158_24585 [Bryobacterales bacterium]|nr:hypothetical protein [Bryobacterales bacterium]